MLVGLELLEKLQNMRMRLYILGCFTVKNGYGYIRRVLGFKKPFKIQNEIDGLTLRKGRKSLSNEADCTDTSKSGYINLYIVMVDDDVLGNKHEVDTSKSGKHKHSKVTGQSSLRYPKKRRTIRIRTYTTTSSCTTSNRSTTKSYNTTNSSSTRSCSTTTFSSQSSTFSN